jgi:hypothetical protein
MRAVPRPRSTLPLLIALASCAGPSRVPNGPPLGVVVDSFSDSYSMSALAEAGDKLYAGTQRGILRFTNRAARGELVATPGLMGHITSLLADDYGELSFVGTDVGLFYNGTKNWLRVGKSTDVRALHATPDALYLGSDKSGLTKLTRPIGPDSVSQPVPGCALTGVRAIASQRPSVIVVGMKDSQPALCYFDGKAFVMYRSAIPLDKIIPSPGALVPPAKESWLVGSGDAWFELRVGPPSYQKGAGELRFEAMTSNQNAPNFYTERVTFPLKNVSAIGASKSGSWVASPMRGAFPIKVGRDKDLVTFDVGPAVASHDIIEDADRMSVACTKAAAGAPQECYVDTNGSAYRFDGTTFMPAEIDPEPGAKILALLSNSAGDVFAIHRGPVAKVTRGKDGIPLRISQVVATKWTPIAFQGVQLPATGADLNFARFDADGHVWLGLRYQEANAAGETIDFGAAEIWLGTNKVVYHRLGRARGKNGDVPDDALAIFLRSANETWFGTRSGAARVRGKDVKVFTENDGLENEIIRDIAAGTDNDVWVATNSGTGRFDDKTWVWPNLPPFSYPSTSLAHDSANHTFVGTDHGVFCTGIGCPQGAIDADGGLLDDAVKKLTLDEDGRLWALTKNGVSLIRLSR